MRQRNFYAGWTATVGGMTFRVRHGKKHPDDLVLDWLDQRGEWVPVPLDVVFLIVDMVAENEDVLYPRPQNGGEEVIRYIRAARALGYQRAIAMLHTARAAKAERLEYRAGA